MSGGDHALIEGYDPTTEGEKPMPNVEPNVEKDAPAEFPSSWVIEVCRTCGRVAQWPFCEHREQRPVDERPWCLPVVVKGSLPAKHRITPPATTEGDDDA